jgi:hypothetical protein
MDPRHHLLYLQLSRTFVDSPELARRRETLRRRDSEASEQRAKRRRERVRQGVALLTARRWRGDRELAGRAG